MIGLPSADTHHNLYSIFKTGWQFHTNSTILLIKEIVYNVFHINNEVTDRNGMSQISPRLVSDLSDYVIHKDTISKKYCK